MNAPQQNIAVTVDKAIAVADARLDAVIRRRYEQALTNPNLQWDTERMYVMQIIRRSDYLAKTVLESPGSLITAVQDAAAMGLSLSPTQGHAYLIPQRPSSNLPAEVICKVSYKGMEQTVLRSGVITSITTELVFKNDTFKHGVNMEGPYLEFERAAGDRGELVGGFCLARYSNGDKHVEVMPVEEINACEAAAIKAANDKTPPSWRGAFKPEMQKKCIVRRAQKHWPSSPVLEKLAAAFDRETPMEFGDTEVTTLLSEEHIKELEAVLEPLGDVQRAHWLLMIAKAENRSSIRDIPDAMFEEVKRRLKTRLDRVLEAHGQKPEEAKPKAKRQRKPRKPASE